MEYCIATILLPF